MMEKLNAAIRSGGIEVPLTINDAYMGANYVNGTGSGDIYGCGFSVHHSSIYRFANPSGL